MNYENNKKQLIHILLAVAIPFAIYKISSVTFLPLITDNIIRPFTGDSIFVCSTIVAAILVKKILTLKPAGKSLGKGLLLAWPVLLLITCSLIMQFSLILTGAMRISIPSWKIIMLVITALIVGITEELLIRGILINGLTDYYGKITPSTIRKAILLSAVVFGALHMFNMLVGVTFSGALIQAVNAALGGVFYGAIYIRSNKNLWPCIIIHGLWDFSGFVSGGMLAGLSTSDTVNSASILALTPSAIFAVYALILLRNKKLKEFAES